MESETSEHNVAHNIGNTLRMAREARGISLEDVSAILKIRSDHLQALELDDFDRLPGSVYVIGFIRTYATYLGLNSAELITRYKALCAPSPLDEANFDQPSESEPISGAVKITIIVVAVFLIYLMWLIAGGARQQDNLTEVPSAPAPSAEAIIDAPSIVSPPAQRPEGVVRDETVPGRVSQPDSVDVRELAPPEQIPSEGAPPEQVSSEQVSPERAASVEAAINAAGGAADAPPTELAPSVPQKVEIRAVRRTWMRIENAEGRVLFSSIIRAGEGFELGVDTPFTLATRDAGALRYHVDGDAVGRAGRRGQILTARQIDRAMILALAN